MNKKFEEQGLVGTDYFVKRVEQLEAKVKRLEKKLKATKITQDIGWEE
jgi:predicted transcriptional regulator